MRVPRIELSRVIFYPFIINPFCWAAFIILVILSLATSWWTHEVIDNKWTKLKLDKKNFRKECMDIFKAFTVIIVNSRFWNRRVATSYTAYLAERFFGSDNEEYKWERGVAGAKRAYIHAKFREYVYREGESLDNFVKRVFTWKQCQIIETFIALRTTQAEQASEPKPSRGALLDYYCTYAGLRRDGKAGKWKTNEYDIMQNLYEVRECLL